MTAARAILDAAMSELELQKTILDLACRTGFLCHHQLVPYRRRADGVHAIVEAGTTPGYPDLVLVHSGRLLVLFVELKTEHGKLSPRQIEWRDAIRAAGGDWRLWRPSMWEVEIVPVLTGVSHEKRNAGD
jgi:hypothetical protein